VQPDETFQTVITLPTGATTGVRIVLDGVNGTITGYYADNRIAFQMSLNPASAIVDYSDDALPELAGFYNGQAVFSQNAAINAQINQANIGWDRSIQELFIDMYNGAGNHERMVLQNFVGGSSGANNLAWSQAAPISVWHTPAFVAPFASGSTSSPSNFPLQWKIDAEDNFILAGFCHLTAGIVAGTQSICTTGITFANLWNTADVNHTNNVGALYTNEFKEVGTNLLGSFALHNTNASNINDNYEIYFCRPLGQIL
jgi:hypothetical protein